MPHSPISPSWRKRSRGNSCFSSKPAAAGAALSATNSLTAPTTSRCSSFRPKSRSMGPKRSSAENEASPEAGYPSFDMRLYDSLTRQIQEVKPVDGHTVKMYSCGPTVYRYIHIGNMRSFMLGDLIRRGLRLEGQDVKWVMNITDVGHMTEEVSDTGRDKMELAMEDEGLSPQQIAQKYTGAFLHDADLVGIERADLYPRASDHIPEMIDIIQRLIEKGHAYEVDGTVYFDVRSFPSYGKLSGNTLEALRAGYRQDAATDPNKRYSADFALWKKAGPGRLMKWPCPLGSETRYRSETECGWEALEGWNERLTSLRKRMAGWSGEARAERLLDQAQAFDRRFRDAVADDLDLPQALVVLNELVGSGAV